MKIGLFLSSQAAPHEDPDTRLNQLVEQVKTAEEQGFSSVLLGHHYLTNSQFFQPLSLLNYLIPHTFKIRLGFGVYLLPLHNPLALAEEFATIDTLSSGRLIVGAGTGYREKEYSALGVPFEERFTRLEEYVPLVKKLWLGESVTTEGSFGRLDSAKIHLLPKQKGGPPIWLGAFGTAGIRRAAALDTSWLAPPDGDRITLQERYDTFRETLDSRGFSIERDYPLMREVIVANDSRTAIENAKRYLLKQYRGYKSWGSVKDLSDEEILRDFALVGTTDMIGEAIEWYSQTLGVTEIIMRIEWMGMDHAAVIESIQSIGEKLLNKVD